VSLTPETLARQHDFFIRRLHSLLGIIPVGVFLIIHLGTNALVTLNTPDNDYFQVQVDRIHALGPALIPVEILFIFLPLAAHAALGVRIWFEGKPNAVAYRYWGNVRYTLQRVTGMIALLFILVHLWHMHWLGDFLPGNGWQFDPHRATATTAYALQAHKMWPPLYAIGVLASVYHFANGIWAFLITWGVTIGPKSQREAGYTCVVVGIVLSIAGLASLRTLMTYEHPEPKSAHVADQPTDETAAAERSATSDEEQN